MKHVMSYTSKYKFIPDKCYMMHSNTLMEQTQKNEQIMSFRSVRANFSVSFFKWKN